MIFITGANGWLGLNLVKSIIYNKTRQWGLNDNEIHAFIMEGTSKDKLLGISSDLNIVEGNILNTEDLARFFSPSNKNSLLFHTAGIIHPRKVSEFFDVNLIGTKNILQSASKKSIKKSIIVSSNSPLGCNPDSNHLFDEESNYNPYMNYGKSKMEMEKLCNKYYDDGLLDLTIIRAPWFYGPFQPDRQKLFFEMIRNGNAPIVGDGQNLRSMSYTENLVQGMILSAIKQVSSGKTYWIADETPYSMNEIIDTVESLMENEFHLECNHGRLRLPNIASHVAEKIDASLQWLGIYNQKIHVMSEMNKNIACNVSLAKSDLGYKPEFSLKEGMLLSLKEIYE